MTTYRFQDCIFPESFFDVECEPYEIHSIELKNKELAEWLEGRIVTRNIFEL